MTGFKGRSGQSFRARLALEQTEEGKWRVEFDEPWAKEGAKPPEAEEAEDAGDGGWLRAGRTLSSPPPPERSVERRVPRREPSAPPAP